MSLSLFSGDLTAQQAQTITAGALHGADDGELYVEHTIMESLTWADGKLKNASYNIDQGFGLRAVAGEFVAYAHANDLSASALQQAAQTVRAAMGGYNGHLALPPAATSHQFYAPQNPVNALGFADKIALLQQIDSYVRDADSRVIQCSINISMEYKTINILRPDAPLLADARPMTIVRLSVVLAENGRTESGDVRYSGRKPFDFYVNEKRLKEAADEALRIARVNLTSIPAPAGELTVVMKGGWSGILLHEAIGHGLEGDFHRKGVSVFGGKFGEAIASAGVTVIDDGTQAGERGCLNFDDEGTATQRNVLIEDGKLVGMLLDRQNARLLQKQSTGSGRRQSYAYAPMPRMNSTFMTNGAHTPEEIIASVKDGIYAAEFSSGQVDIVSGSFVFQMAEAYKIENGKITAPLKGATLIGQGHEALKQISMIGNDSSIDPGGGTCGKSGQGVPVNVGLPTIRLDGITVGGV